MEYSILIDQLIGVLRSINTPYSTSLALNFQKLDEFCAPKLCQGDQRCKIVFCNYVMKSNPLLID